MRRGEQWLGRMAGAGRVIRTLLVLVLAVGLRGLDRQQDGGQRVWAAETARCSQWIYMVTFI